MLFIQPVADDGTDDRGAAQATTGQDPAPDLPAGIGDQLNTDIVGVNRGPVFAAAAYGDLELAWQEGEFGMQGRPLPDDLAVGTGVFKFIGRHTGILVGGSVANTIATGLDGMHLYRGQLGQDIGHLLQARPVELDVLARAHMGVALVINARDLRQLAQFGAVEQAVGHGDPQHRSEALYIEAVLQAQWQEFSITQLPGQETGGLAAKLVDPLIDYGLVIFVVNVH